MDVDNDLTRRSFLGTAGAAGLAALAVGSGAVMAQAAEADAPAKAGAKIKIVAVNCSPRKGKGTATALQVALDAAGQAGNVEVELIELAELAIDGGPAAGIALPAGAKDDFPAVAAKLADPAVRGIIIGTPVYFSGMSYLCKAFLDRWMAFRKNFALADKVAGVLAAGGSLHGGQEVAIRSVQDALFCHDMIVVGAGRPTSRFGAVVWTGKADDKDSQDAAKNLGLRVAKVALALAGK